MATDTRKILVTSALPYANGSLHLGHMVEHIQSDIWVRYLRMRGHTCFAVCGDDAHGTPIMLSAEQQGITPEALIAASKTEHEQDLQGFHVHYDTYHTTHSPENQKWVEHIYQALKANEDFEVRSISQAFDAEKQMFLPDRFVKGECPKCGASDQYGDCCEQCGATYTPLEMRNPVSVLTGSCPIEKTSEHIFFRLDRYTQFLQQWAGADKLQPEVANKLNEWFEAGLTQWNISRDAPYFGFEIPDHPNKYFYVWMDAPVGYMASFEALCAQNSEIDFDSFWRDGSNTELYHFVGKDIIYFHALFWPAMLHSAQLRTPTAIFSHGFLTVNGAKMSKSRGTFIKASTYLEHLPAECLRYYYAAKLGTGIDDIDLNLEDFVLRVNSDLVGKVVNIASRCAGFIHKRFDGKLSAKIGDSEQLQGFVQAGQTIGELYEARDYARAMRHIMALADKANQYIDAHKPWVLAKSEDTLAQAHEVCSMGLNYFKILITYLAPVLPEISEQARAFLQVPALSWANREDWMQNHAIATFEPLLTRIQPENIEALKTAAKTNASMHTDT